MPLVISLHNASRSASSAGIIIIVCVPTLLRVNTVVVYEKQAKWGVGVGGGGGGGE